MDVEQSQGEALKKAWQQWRGQKHALNLWKWKETRDAAEFCVRVGAGGKKHCRLLKVQQNTSPLGNATSTC